jgi:hypothetical protein
MIKVIEPPHSNEECGCLPKVLLVAGRVPATTNWTDSYMALAQLCQYVRTQPTPTSPCPRIMKCLVPEKSCLTVSESVHHIEWMQRLVNIVSQASRCLKWSTLTSSQKIHLIDLMLYSKVWVRLVHDTPPTLTYYLSLWKPTSTNVLSLAVETLLLL